MIHKSLITNIIHQTNLFVFLRPNYRGSQVTTARYISVEATVFRNIEVIDAFRVWRDMHLSGCSFDNFISENIFVSMWDLGAVSPVVDCRFYNFYTCDLVVKRSGISVNEESYNLTQCSFDNATVVMASYSVYSAFHIPYILHQCSLRNTNWHIILRSTYCTTFGEGGVNMSFGEWYTYGTSVIVPMTFTSSVFHTAGNLYVTSYTATVSHIYIESCRVGTDTVLGSWLSRCDIDMPYPICGEESSVKESYVEAFLPSHTLTGVSSAHPSLSRASTATPKPVTSTDTGSSGGKGLSGAVIGAISCGVIVAVCVVVFIIVRVVKKNKPGRSSLEEFSDSSPPSHKSIPPSDDVVVTSPSPLPPPVHKSPPIVHDSVTSHMPPPPPPPPPPPVPKSPLLVHKSPPVIPKSPPPVHKSPPPVPKSSPMSPKGVPPESFSVADMIKTFNG
jgi:hypothetical protein